MILTIRGCAPLVIPETLTAASQGSFGASTPYLTKVLDRISTRSYREKKLPLKLSCLEVLRARMEGLGGFSSFSEPLAGIGLSARIFAAPEMRLSDLDAGCCEVLRTNFPGAHVTMADAFEEMPPEADAAFLDFNTFTLKRYEKHKRVLDGAFERTRKFLIVNDCTLFYFRYGASAYETYSKFFGKEIRSSGDYFSAAAAFFEARYPSWKLVQTAAFRESAFHLFFRGEAPHRWEEIKVPAPVLHVEGALR